MFNWDEDQISIIILLLGLAIILGIILVYNHARLSKEKLLISIKPPDINLTEIDLQKFIDKKLNKDDDDDDDDVLLSMKKVDSMPTQTPPPTAPPQPKQSAPPPPTQSYAAPVPGYMPPPPDDEEGLETTTISRDPPGAAPSVSGLQDLLSQ